ncbi:MAG: hypothetical protein H6709_00725 [Kofleriaceae bacterium]|nr:hypothetical protein [Kofleriaceae bacterium]MCB9570591.1 hypothetical protein [Kofleriaceae bacterium]
MHARVRPALAVLLLVGVGVVAAPRARRGDPCGRRGCAVLCSQVADAAADTNDPADLSDVVAAVPAVPTLPRRADTAVDLPPAAAHAAPAAVAVLPRAPKTSPPT